MVCPPVPCTSREAPGARAFLLVVVRLARPLNGSADLATEGQARPGTRESPVPQSPSPPGDT